MRKFYEILIVTLVLLLPVFSFAEVARFTFSTEPQGISASVLSDKITVHSETPVLETTYVSLTSTSATGQFFSNTSSVDPVMNGTYIYISSGNSNRTFYYKDSTAGDFIISANIWNKDKTQKLSTITQHIVIGGGKFSASTSTDASIPTPNNPNPVLSDMMSAHSSPSPVGAESGGSIFEISAGRDRLTAVGNSVTLQVKPTKLKDIPELSIGYTWSFGDGSTSQGNLVKHTYRFPGEYAVVVNANYSDKQAVSRINIKVISPVIIMDKVPGGFELSNKSGGEINLEGWSIATSKKTFIFPNDTLISAGKKIVFADEVTGLLSLSAMLINPIGKQVAVVSEFVPDVIVASSSPVNETKDTNVVNIPIRIEESAPVAQRSVKTSDLKLAKATSTENLKNTAVVFEAVKKEGLVTKLFSWPTKSFNFLRHLFIEN